MLPVSLRMCFQVLLVLVQPIANLNSYPCEGLGEGHAALIAWWGAERGDVDGRVSAVVAASDHHHSSV